MKIILIKPLDIRYNEIPDLSRANRRLLQKGAKVDVPLECGEFLIQEGFAEEVIEIKKKPRKKKSLFKETYFNEPIDNDDDESSNYGGRLDG